MSRNIISLCLTHRRKVLSDIPFTFDFTESAYETRTLAPCQCPRNLSLRLHMIRARSREAFYNGASTVEHGLTVLRFQANRRRQRIGEGG